MNTCKTPMGLNLHIIFPILQLLCSPTAAAPLVQQNSLPQTFDHRLTPLQNDSTLQSTSTWKSIHSPQPWTNITMNSTDFTRQWLRLNRPEQRHWQIVDGNQRHSNLNTIYFTSNAMLPPDEGEWEIEDQPDFGVYHMIPPQMFWQLAVKTYNENSNGAGKEIVSLLLAGTPWFFEATNDVNNSIATYDDLRLGALRELLLVSTVSLSILTGETSFCQPGGYCSATRPHSISF